MKGRLVVAGLVGAVVGGAGPARLAAQWGAELRGQMDLGGPTTPTPETRSGACR